MKGTNPLKMICPFVKKISYDFQRSDIYALIDTWNFVLETGPSADDYIRDPDYLAEASL